MQDRQGAPYGTGVALRDGTASQESGRVVRAEAEKLREEFEDLLLGWVASGKLRTFRERCRAWRHAHHYSVPRAWHKAVRLAARDSVTSVIRDSLESMPHRPSAVRDDTNG